MTKKPTDDLSIGALAERTGLAPSAIRFYEGKGLIAPTRSEGGQRRYERADLRRLSFIMVAQGLGFTLRQIADELSALPDGRVPTQRDWERMGKRFREELDARIQGLTELRGRLSSCIGCGCLSLRSCRLHNPGDAAEVLGQGPRFLVGDSPDEVPDAGAG